jgi:hypothetical protein
MLSLERIGVIIIIIIIIIIAGVGQVSSKHVRAREISTIHFTITPAILYIYIYTNSIEDFYPFK